jgi:hypothetical protein
LSAGFGGILAGCLGGGTETTPETETATQSSTATPSSTATGTASPTPADTATPVDGPDTVSQEFVRHFYGAADSIDGEHHDMFPEVGIHWSGDSIRWKYVEPTKGEYDWSWADKVFAEDVLAKYEIEKLAGVGLSPPEWALSDRDDRRLTPEGVDAFADYVQAAVERYDHIDVWQIANEPNFWDTTNNPKVYYEEHLKPAAAVLHDHDKRVLGPEVSVHVTGTVQGAITAIEDFILYADAIEHLDYLSFHYPHGDLTVPGLVENKLPMWDYFYEEYVQPGQLAGLWNTEGGINTEPFETPPISQYAIRYSIPVLHWALRHEWNERDTYKFHYYHMGAGPWSGSYKPKHMLTKTDAFEYDDPSKNLLVESEGMVELNGPGTALQTVTSELYEGDPVSPYSESIAMYTGTNASSPSARLTVDGDQSPSFETVGFDELASIVSPTRYAPIQSAPTADGDVDWAALAERPATISLPATDDQIVSSASAEEGLASIYGGPEDLSTDVTMAYDDDALYFHATVTDDVHNGISGSGMYNGDGFQVVSANSGYGPEYGIAHADGEPAVWRWKDSGVSVSKDDVDLETSRDGTTTTYRARFPWPTLYTGTTPQAGESIPLTFLLNENDGEERHGWLQWTPGVGSTKTTKPFGSLELVGDDQPWTAWLSGPQSAAEGEAVSIGVNVANYSGAAQTVAVSVPTLGIDGVTVEVPANRIARHTVRATASGAGQYGIEGTASAANDGREQQLAHRMTVAVDCSVATPPVTFRTYGFQLGDDVLVTAWTRKDSPCDPSFPLSPTVEIAGVSEAAVEEIVAIDFETGERTTLSGEQVTWTDDGVTLSGFEMAKPVQYLRLVGA